MCEQCRAGGLMSYCLDDKTMTLEQKLRKLWEAVDGNCWHEVIQSVECVGNLCSCGESTRFGEECTPNPTLTLDVLFEIAEKLLHKKVWFFTRDGNGFNVTVLNNECSYSHKTTDDYQNPQLALLDALYQAIKDK